MDEFTPLTSALDSWLVKPFDDLPEALRSRVEEAFFPHKWDELHPDDRRKLAEQLDYQTDPAHADQRRLHWNHEARMHEIEAQIARWELTPTPAARDLEIKETRLLGLRAELDRMQSGPDDVGRDPPACGESANDADGKPKSAHCSIFRAMPKLLPHEVRITFAGDKLEGGLGANNVLEISARNTTRRVPLAELELINRRKGEPNRQCGLLLGMALKKKISRAGENTKGISRLRSTLRTNLGIEGDPFATYNKDVGWEPLFALYDNRGDADERARLAAERRTSSYEELLERGAQFADVGQSEENFADEDDDAARFLRENSDND